MTLSDETLMAYVDGELDAGVAEEVARAVATDPALAARLATFRESRLRLREAFGTAPPVSAGLEAKVRALAAAADAPGNVVSLARRRAAPRRATAAWRLPLAAALALAVGAAGGWFAGGGAPVPGDGQLASLAGAEVSAALSGLAAGEETGVTGGRIAVIASFRDAEGRLCREFEHDEVGGGTLVAVACAEDGAWGVRFAVAAAAEDGGYAPASSLEVLDSYLSATGAGAPLSPGEEAAALSTLR